MSTSESIQALRRANPRAQAGFAQAVEAVADAARARIARAADPVQRVPRSSARRRLAGVSVAGVSLAAAAAVAALLTVGSPGGRGVEDATAAVRNAATLSAASAERSGSAFVRITHGGEIWAERTIQWHGGDLAVSDQTPRRGRRPASHMRLVDGILYGTDPRDGGWVVLGSPESIDPDSGTTPDEYLAAVQEDVGGATLRRITEGMTGLTTGQLPDGSTGYRGTVAAGLIAGETGVKSGQSIRVLPFGYVAHDEAANPDARLLTAVTVGPDGVVREIFVHWGAGASAWTYRVTYAGLGTTPAPPAPANAKPFPDRSVAGRG